jgi:hypothetical protein
MEVEASERLLANAYTTFRPQKPAEEYELAVVISTYNRADFVSMNVEWLLRQITQDNLPVVCVVVDNVSTDDTRTKLSLFSTTHTLDMSVTRTTSACSAICRSAPACR